MKASRRVGFFSSSSTTTVTYTYPNEHSTPDQPQTKTIEIPIESSTEPPAIPITVHLQPAPQPQIPAAVKIQSAYRSYVVRGLVKTISAVNSEANSLERLIQRQETVDAIRADDREKIRMNEALMRLLLRLDSVPGVDQAVRELRRRVSRRIVGLQEILDGIADTRLENLDGFRWNWDDVLADIEEDACRERGGHELERFCAENLGFRCLQRFLRDQNGKLTRELQRRRKKDYELRYCIKEKMRRKSSH